MKKIFFVAIFTISIFFNNGCGRKKQEPVESAPPSPSSTAKQNTTYKKHNYEQIYKSTSPNHPSRNQQKQKSHNYTSHTQLLRWINDIQAKKNIDISREYRELGKDICAENLNNALNLVRTISDNFIRSQIYAGIFEELAYNDPQQALAIAESLNPAKNPHDRTVSINDYETALIESLKGMAELYPDKAIAYVNNIKSKNLQLSAQRAIYEGWGKNDAESALKSAESLDDSQQKMIIPLIFKGWATRDALAAAQYAKQMISNGSIKRVISNYIASELYKTQIDNNTDSYSIKNSIQTITASFPKEIQPFIIPRLYRKLAKISPEEAADFYISNSSSNISPRDPALANIIRAWALKNPEDVIAWADKTFNNDEDFVAVIQKVIANIRYRSPKTVAKLLESLPFTYDDDTTGMVEVYNLISTWGHNKPQEAIQWIDSLPYSKMKIIAIKSMASTLTLKNYKDAFTWANNIKDPDLQAYAYSNIALKQSFRKLKFSDNWIEKLPEGFIKTRTVAGYALGAVWRIHDQTAVDEFKKELSNDELNVPTLIHTLQNSKLDEATKNKMIYLLQ